MDQTSTIDVTRIAICMICAFCFKVIVDNLDYFYERYSDRPPTDAEFIIGLTEDEFTCYIERIAIINSLKHSKKCKLFQQHY